MCERATTNEKFDEGCYAALVLDHQLRLCGRGTVNQRAHPSLHAQTATHLEHATVPKSEAYFFSVYKGLDKRLEQGKAVLLYDFLRAVKL